MRVLFATSEATPFSKTGGLGDVAGSLPPALRAAGVDCKVIMPKYGTIAREFIEQMDHVADFYVPLAWRNVWCGIDHLKHDGVDLYFVDNEDYFYREAPYGYFDDGERFAFFSKAICEAMEWIEPLQCDIVHCNDWQTALVPVFMREFYHAAPWYESTMCVLTVHNIKFQGQYSDFVLGDILGLADVPAAASQLRCDATSINYMKGGLCYADALTTVSPTYAEELKMPFFGEHLEGVFQERAPILSGVLNGIDMAEYNPATDKLIAANFTVDDLSGKAECKRALQEELGLEVDPTRPLVAMIGRLTKQKGLDLVQYAIDTLMGRGIQLVVLGTGDANYEDAMRHFDWKYPGQMRACIAFDSALSHRIYSAADLFLMPSQFEPCGLSQMMAMRYGTLPVVRETGGLVDSVEAYNQYTGEGTGFRFANMNADEMANVLLDACEVFWTDKKAWKRIQKQAMETDFSWSRAADDYLDMYYGLHPELAR